MRFSFSQFVCNIGVAFAITAPPARAQCSDQWLAGDGLPGIDGILPKINAAAVYDDGRGPAVYLGGHFEQAGELVTANIVRWDGNFWEAVGGGIPYPAHVGSMALFDGRLVVSGGFRKTGDVDANHISQ